MAWFFVSIVLTSLSVMALAAVNGDSGEPPTNDGVATARQLRHKHEVSDDIHQHVHSAHSRKEDPVDDVAEDGEDDTVVGTYAPPEVPCQDNNGAAIANARAVGAEIIGCEEIVEYCEDDLYGPTVRQDCPYSCLLCVDDTAPTAGASVNSVVKKAAEAGVIARAAADAGAVSSDLQGDIPTLLNNNMGGLGPTEDSEFQALVFGNIGKLANGDTPVAVLLYNITAYQAGEIALNGFSGAFPAINVLADTNVTVRGVFINSRTGMPQKLESFKLTVVDMNANTDGTGQQEVLAKGFSSYAAADETTIQINKTEEGYTSFLATATTAADEFVGDPLDMSDSQMAGSVLIVWKHTSTFEFTLQVTGASAEPGRTFKFSGLSSLDPNAGDDEALGAVEVQKLYPDGQGLEYMPTVACVGVMLLVFVCFRCLPL